MSGILPRYTHIVNARLKHTYLSFDDNGELIIKSPPVSQAYIEALLLKKSGWIRKSQKKIGAKKGRADTIRENGHFYLLGTACTLHFKQSASKRARLEETKPLKSFTFVYPCFNRDLCKQKIEMKYREEIERHIPPLVDFWSEKMQLYPKMIHYRKTKRQWGSCSSQNVLSFNTMLMKVPFEAIEYVVVHELAHIAHKHHQKAFWQLVETHLPDYHKRQEILREYTPV